MLDVTNDFRNKCNDTFAGVVTSGSACSEADETQNRVPGESRPW